MPVEKSLFDSPPKPAPVVAVPPAPAPVPHVVSATSKLPTLPDWLLHPSRRTLFEAIGAVVLAVSLLGHVGGLSLPSFPWSSSVTAPLKATLVRDVDSNDPTATAQAIVADATLGATLKNLGCDWRTYDKSSPTLASAGLTSYIGDPPTLIVQVQGVNTPPIHKHVTTPAEVIDAVKQLRGVK